MKVLMFVILFSYAHVAGSQVFSFGSFENSGTKDQFDKKPDYFLLEWQEEKVLKSNEIKLDIDTYDLQTVDKLVDRKNQPVLYTAKISTPVCADGECRLMDIRFYWDLLGNYAGFDKIAGLPLTKNEHEEFTEDDYMKLHQLLQNENSVLGERSIDELVVEAPEASLPEGVDALSGATIAELEGATVEGALYSCHVAWNLTNGNIQQKLKEHTLTILDEEMLNEMLYSNNKEYQLFALKNLHEKQYLEKHERIIDIFKRSNPLTRRYIVKNLPESFWQEKELQQELWNNFAAVDLGTRSLLLEHLGDAPKPALTAISQEVKVLTANQLELYLNFLQQEKSNLDPEIRKNLQKTVDSKEYTYSYLISQFLSSKE